MVIMTLIIIGAVLLLAAGLYFIAGYFMEMEHGFVYFAWGMIALLVCVAAYLTYAVPSFAVNTKPAVSSPTTSPAPTGASTAPAASHQDTEINLLQE
jgi:hypothetical protein